MIVYDIRYLKKCKSVPELESAEGLLDVVVRLIHTRHQQRPPRHADGLHEELGECTVRHVGFVVVLVLNAVDDLAHHIQRVVFSSGLVRS